MGNTKPNRGFGKVPTDLLDHVIIIKENDNAVNYQCKSCDSVFSSLKIFNFRRHLQVRISLSIFTTITIYGSVSVCKSVV